MTNWQFDKLDVDLDTRVFCWRPYCQFGKYPNIESAQYFGHYWFLVINFLWFELTIYEPYKGARC